MQNTEYTENIYKRRKLEKKKSNRKRKRFTDQRCKGCLSRRCILKNKCGMLVMFYKNYIYYMYNILIGSAFIK